MISRLEVAPGGGVVIRYGHVVAWTSADASSSLLAFLIESARNLAGSPEAGQILVDHLASVLSSADPEPQVGFAVAGPGLARWVSLVHGPAQGWDGASWTIAPTQPGWARTIVAPSPALSLNAAGSPLPEGSPSSLLDLEAGVVPGGGLTLWPSPVLERITLSNTQRERADEDQGIDEEPTSTLTISSSGAGNISDFESRDATTQEADPSGDAISEASIVVDLRPGASGTERPSSAAAPNAAARAVTVDGVRCHRGHFNRPGMIFCALCSSPIRSGDEPPGPGPRPPLGCLITSDGSVYRLDSDYVVGGDEHPATRTSNPAGPTSDERENADRRPRQLPLAGDPTRRGRAEILLQGWDVVVVDGGSEVGTYTYPPGASAWQKMPYRTTEVVAPGSHISFGRDVVTYINPWVPAASDEPTRDSAGADHRLG